MKKKKLKSSRQNYLFTGIAGIVLSSSHSPFDNANVLKNQHAVERKSTAPFNEFKKDKKNLVKIVHNPETNSIRVAVKDLAGQTIDFYVFDLEGTMVVNCKLRSREKKMITDLRKGAYTYNAFAGDEEVDFGKIVIE
jgi:hypothetical protein